MRAPIFMLSALINSALAAPMKANVNHELYSRDARAGNRPLEGHQSLTEMSLSLQGTGLQTNELVQKRMTPIDDITGTSNLVNRPRGRLEKNTVKGSGPDEPTKKAPAKRPRTETTEDKSEMKKLRAEHMSVRRQKARVLGLHFTSALPVFSHDLEVKKINDYPHINKWHTHREALERGDIKYDQLPPYFKSARGQFIFSKEGGKNKGQYSGDVLYSARIKRASKSRTTRMNLLQLRSTSAVPRFAANIPLPYLEHHPLFNSWHEHRVKVEKGEMKKEDLPTDFQNDTSSGGLAFRLPARKKGAHLKNPSLTSQEKKRILAIQARAKLYTLGLHPHSAMPIFAHKVKAEDLPHHEETNSWNDHRMMLEKGQIGVAALPEQYKPYRGSFRLRTNTKIGRPRKSVQSSQVSPTTQEHNTFERMHNRPAESQRPTLHDDHAVDARSTSSELQNTTKHDNDPLAFLHDMQLD